MKKESLLRLFKGYENQEETKEINKEALKYGILIKSEDKEIVDMAIKQYGKDGVKWNSTFHKDFEIVRNAPIEDLIIQQMIHYITTYGYEDIGIYNPDTVYIPKEKLEVPELKEDIELVVIKGLSEEEINDKMMVLLTSGIALSEETVKDIIILSEYIDKEKLDEIKNKEVKTALYEKYNIMPSDPEEFLRYLLFKITDNTLKIQNYKMIEDIKSGDKEKALEMLKSYIEKNGYEKLSSIFLRNKRLFLALKVKKSKEINAIINKLRKLADINHKPMKKNVLDCLTDEKVEVNLYKLHEMLDKVTIFREIRILNGLLYRLNGNKAIVHRIRNGKSYVRTLENKTFGYVARLETIIKVVKTHLNTRMSEKVKGKVIYIPKNVTYTAPTSEKQFSGNIPDGSYMEVPREDNLVYGIHWKNIEKEKLEKDFYGSENFKKNREERVDLDLKQMNKNEVFGWDSSYRSSNSDILFSGDITDAKLPNGATELFYVGQNYGHGAFLITLNMFTTNSEDVPYEFVIAKATHRPRNRVKYVLDPNNILAKVDMTVKKDEKQKVVGFITIGDTIRFYFNDFSAGSGISSKQDDVTMGAFDYLQAYSKTQLKLKDLLEDAGAVVIDKMVEEKIDIDLSVNNITKESIIKLLS